MINLFLNRIRSSRFNDLGFRAGGGEEGSELSLIVAISSLCVSLSSFLVS